MAHSRNGAPKLKQILHSWQIFSISVTVVIGSGVFNDYGSAAKTCGPVGLLIVFLIVGVLAIFSMESFSELLQLFPTVNPMVELVHEFVDPSLARVVGFAYWFAYSSFMPVQVSTASGYLNLYVPNTDGWEASKIVTFWVLAPLIITLLNIAPVRYFGMIESAGGLIKLGLLLVVILMLFYVAGEAHGSAFWDQGVISRLSSEGLPGSAICLSIEFIAFSFLGIESIAVTSFEALDIEDVRRPSKWVTPVTFIVYFFCAIAQIMTLDWRNESSVSALADQNTPPYSLEGGRSTTSALIIAALRQHENTLARALNGIMMFCALSAANSTVYVSSRMLYGMAYMNAKESRNQFWNWLAYVNENGVPLTAVLVSSAAFAWLPFTQLAHDQVSASRLISWFNNAGSLCVLFCWGAVNLAYIRYFFWFHSFKTVLREEGYERLDRKSDRKGFHTFLWRAQPGIAAIAFVSSIVIVFGFSSAALWKPRNSVAEFFEFYTIPLLLPLCWIVLKAYTVMKEMRHGKSFDKALKDVQFYVKLTNKRRQFETTISNLTEFLKPSQRPQVTSMLVEARQGDEEEETDEGIAMDDMNGVRRRTTVELINE